MTIESVIGRLKAIPVFTKLKVSDVNGALVKRLICRDLVVNDVTCLLDKIDRYPIQRVHDILSMKPVTTVRGETIDIAKAVINLTAKHGSVLTSLDTVDIIECALKWRIMAKPIRIDRKFNDGTVISEVLNRLPVNDSNRSFMSYNPTDSMTVYFLNNRMMVIADYGMPNHHQSTEVFVAIWDLGSLFKNYVSGVTTVDNSENSPIKRGRLYKEAFTGMFLVDRKIDLHANLDWFDWIARSDKKIRQEDYKLSCQLFQLPHHKDESIWCALNRHWGDLVKRTSLPELANEH